MMIFHFGYYLFLFAGSLALLLTTYRRYRRTGDPLLLSYAYYLLAFNATVFDSGIGGSFLSLTANIRLLSASSIETFSKILCLLSVPLWFVGWYLFLRLVARLMSRDISRIVWIVYLATQLLAAAGFALMVANFASTPGPVPSRAYATAFMAVRWLGCFIRFWALAQIIFYIGNVRDGWRRKSVLAFGGLYAGLLIIHYGLLLLPLPTAIFALVYPTAYFASDLVPLIYLLAVLRKESWGIPALSSRAGGLNGLDGFGELTKREREIVSLILSGKDNIDIHRALYISAGTVRNHVSNIYKKLGLKNRYQLLALARKDVGID